MQLRQTAYKLWVVNVINNKFYTAEQEFDPDYILFNNQKISRVNLIGNVIDIFKNDDNSYASVTIDDNSATIKIKVFNKDINLFDNIKKGDLILVVGKLREYQNEIYILPDFVRNLEDLNWDLVRKIELLRLIGKTNKKLVKEIISPSKMALFNIIREKGDAGINLEELNERVTFSDEELKSLLNKLIEDGEIYQDRPNNFRAF